MRAARLVVLGVALAAGLGAAYLATQLTGRNEGEQTPPTAAVQSPVPATTVEILVAARDLPYGTLLANGDFAWAAWPEAVVNANPNYIRRSTSGTAARTALVNQYVISSFSRSEPILPGKIGVSLSLAGSLPPGMRATAVNVRAVGAAGGFVLPGDYVDVLLVTDNSARTILTDVYVMAVDQQTAAAEGAQTVVPDSTVTLALSPADVELVTAANSAGTISLSLRSRSDSNLRETAAATGGAASPERTTVTIVGAGVASTTSVQVPRL